MANIHSGYDADHSLSSSASDASLRNSSNLDARSRTSSQTKSVDSFAWGTQPPTQGDQHFGPASPPTTLSPQDRLPLLNRHSSNARNRQSTDYADRGVPRRHRHAYSTSGDDLRNAQLTYHINPDGNLDETPIEELDEANRQRHSSTETEIGVESQHDGQAANAYRNHRLSSSDNNSSPSKPMSLAKRLGAAFAVGVVAGAAVSTIGFGIGGACGAVTFPFIGVVPGAVVGAAIGGTVGFLAGFIATLCTTGPKPEQTEPATLSGHSSTPPPEPNKCYKTSSGGNESDLSISEWTQTAISTPGDFHRNTHHKTNDRTKHRHASRRSSPSNPLDGTDYLACMERINDLTDVRQMGLDWHRQHYPRQSRPQFNADQMTEDLKGTIRLDIHLHELAESDNSSVSNEPQHDYEDELEHKTIEAANHFMATLQTARNPTKRDTQKLANACANLLYTAQLFAGVVMKKEFTRSQLEIMIQEVLKCTQPPHADEIPPEKLLGLAMPARQLYQASQQLAEGFPDETEDDKGCGYASQLVQLVLQLGLTQLASNSDSPNNSNAAVSKSNVLTRRLQEIGSDAGNQFLPSSTAALLHGLPRVLVAARNIPLPRGSIESSDQSLP